MKKFKWEECEFSLEYDDFIKPELIADVMRIDWDKTDEIMAVVSCSVSPAIPQTYWQPAEDSEIEDLEINVVVDGKKIDIYDMLTPNKLILIEEKVRIDAIEWLYDE